MDKTELASLQLITVRWWNATAYYAVYLAKWLRQAGYPVWVGSPAELPPAARARELEVPVFSDIRTDSVSPRQFWRNMKRLKFFINQNKIRIINAHRPEDHLYAGLLKQRSAGITAIRTIGDVRPPRNNPVNRWLHLQATDFFIFSCEANKKRYQAVWPIPEEKTAVVYAGIDTDYFRPDSGEADLRQEIGIPADALVFGLIARFSPVKDHATFLKAASLITEFTPNVFFLISGEDVEITQSDLRRQARDLDIESHVYILKKQPDVRRVIRAVDVGVVPSSGSEAIARIATEFMAMGRPVICSDVNVLPEMIKDGREGFVFPARSYTALADRMRLFVENPPLREILGQQARETAQKRFSSRVFLQQTLAVYHNILNQIGVPQ